MRNSILVVFGALFLTFLGIMLYTIITEGGKLGVDNSRTCLNYCFVSAIGFVICVGFYKDED